MSEYRISLPNETFGTIVADPPWALQSTGVRRKLHYDRMSLDEIKNIPVVDVSSPDAHLWLWTTNPHLPEALEVMKHWGFEYKSMLTWKKNRMGTGWWLRSKTEHVLWGVRSKKLRKNPGNITTIFEAPYRGHSIKPVEAFEIFEKLSPSPRLEIFAREPRDGWTTVISDALPVDNFDDTVTTFPVSGSSL